MERVLVGKVKHFFSKISVAAIKLSGDLKVGDRIVIATSEGDVEMPVESMQIEKESIKEAKAGQAVGMKVHGKVREGNEVFKIVE